MRALDPQCSPALAISVTYRYNPRLNWAAGLTGMPRRLFL